MVHFASAERSQSESVLQVSLLFTILYFEIYTKSIFRVNIPDIYKSTYGEICRADATAIDLGKLNKYFYELGRYVAAFDQNGFVGKMIYEVCAHCRFVNN